VLNKYLFDETLMGYSMREDLDMSYRVAGEYKILYLPGASLLHSESSTERLDAVKFGEADLRSWHWFVKKNMPSLTNQICFYWGAFGYLLLLLLRFLLYKNNTYHMRAVGGVRALLGIMGYPVIHER
jgi:GT2 family glycosyltransferase